jgi:hypothetical protein
MAFAHGMLEDLGAGLTSRLVVVVATLLIGLIAMWRKLARKS